MLLVLPTLGVNLRSRHWSLCPVCIVHRVRAWIQAEHEVIIDFRVESCTNMWPSLHCKQQTTTHKVNSAQIWKSTLEKQYLLKKMFELFHRASGPSEASFRVTQVTHDEAILPRTASGPGTTEIAWRWGTIVDAAKSVWETKERQ